MAKQTLQEARQEVADAWTEFKAALRGLFITETEARICGDRFRKFHIPGLFYHAHNITAACGHMRLFGKPLRGMMIYSYGRQVPNALDWAYHRRWNFGFFCVHHVEPGKKATDPAGWHITWAKLKFAKVYAGFSVTWQWADTFKCRKEPKRQRSIW